MRRFLMVLVASLLLGDLAIAQESQPNPLAGHEVEATLPGLVLVQTDAVLGVTWDGPLVLVIDGRPSAHIALPLSSVAIPGARALPWWREAALTGLGGALGALLGGIVDPAPRAILACLALGAGGGAAAGGVWFLTERLPPRKTAK